MNMIPKVSIIITIYNREKYIETCARSLFEQTLKELEFIFIDDASTDHSIEKLERIISCYPGRFPFIKIIRLKKNGGVSNARNVGMENVTGEYVIHADSDDWVDNDMYERLYNLGKESNADIVGCNMWHEFINNRYEQIQPYSVSVKDNIRKLIRGDIHPSLCTSLTRISLISNNNICFPIGLNMGEDLLYNLQIYLRANKIVKADIAPYHYRHAQDSSSYHLKKESVYNAIEISRQMESLMKANNLYNEYAIDIEFKKFSMKFALVWNFENKDNYKEWLNIFPETHKYIWQFKQIEWKLRLELWFAAHHMFYIAKFISKGLEWQHSFKTFKK